MSEVPPMTTPAPEQEPRFTEEELFQQFNELYQETIRYVNNDEKSEGQKANLKNEIENYSKTVGVYLRKNYSTNAILQLQNFGIILLEKLRTSLNAVITILSFQDKKTIDKMLPNVITNLTSNYENLSIITKFKELQPQMIAELEALNDEELKGNEANSKVRQEIIELAEDIQDTIADNPISHTHNIQKDPVVNIIESIVAQNLQSFKSYTNPNSMLELKDIISFRKILIQELNQAFE